MRILLWLIGLLCLPLIAESELEKSYVDSVNTMIGLTADDYIGAGSYTLTDNTVIDIYHLPLLYHFDPIYDDINLYVNGAVGYSKATQDIPSIVKIVLKMKLAKLGGGIRYQPTKNWYLSVGASMIYTELHDSATFGADVNQSLLDPITVNLLNARQENWTTEYIVKTRYEHEIAEFIPYIDGEYQFYKTESTLKLDSVVTIDSVMEMAHLKFGTFTPVLGTLGERTVRLEGKYGYTWMFGDFRDALNSDYYETYSGLIHFDAISEKNWLKNVYLISEWTQGKGFDGYNLGIGLEFNF